MSTVETTITLSVRDAGSTLAELEAQVSAALAEAGRTLLLAACRAMEEQLLAARAKDGLQRVKVRPRDLLTRFGWLRLPRQQVRHRGRYQVPLDDLLQLPARSHASPWVVSEAVALATRIPYRQATLLLADLLATDLDHRTVYDWVRQAGARVVEEEDRQQQAVFQDGEEPASEPGVREIVVTEVDGTFLKAQREAGPDFEVRLGVLYSGKELVSPAAQHRRYRLGERVRYGGVEAARDFGERLFLAGEARLGLSHADHLLLVGDGAEWIETLAGHARWRATYQLDWWHLCHALHRTFPDRPAFVADLKQLLYQGESDRLLQLVRLAKVSSGEGDERQRVARLDAYLQANQHGFYGARRLRRQLSPAGQLAAVEGSGAIEKHVDLAVDRRFKGQGMRWTRKGANWLLKLRLRELDRAA